MNTDPSGDPAAIRPLYDKHGAAGYYERFGANYRNPHEPIVRALIEQAVKSDKLLLPGDPILDLACGSGEATLALRELGFSEVAGTDPYTGIAYLERTGKRAEAHSFEDIATGALEGRRYSLIVCSFALHLAQASLLPALCWQLALVSERLWILTPHKRPVLRQEWGWELSTESLVSRVRLRTYTSRL